MVVENDVVSVEVESVVRGGVSVVVEIVLVEVVISVVVEMLLVEVAVSLVVDSVLTLVDMAVDNVIVVSGPLPVAACAKSRTENDSTIGTENVAASMSFFSTARRSGSTASNTRSNFPSFIDTLPTHDAFYRFPRLATCAVAGLTRFYQLDSPIQVAIT
jgi:hypothetical protein